MGWSRSCFCVSCLMRDFFEGNTSLFSVPPDSTRIEVIRSLSATFRWSVRPVWLKIATAGWWFGTWILFFCIGNKNPNWRSPSFFRGVGWNHQPLNNCWTQSFGDGGKEWHIYQVHVDQYPKTHKRRHATLRRFHHLEQLGFVCIWQFPQFPFGDSDPPFSCQFVLQRNCFFIFAGTLPGTLVLHVFFGFHGSKQQLRWHLAEILGRTCGGDDLGSTILRDHLLMGCEWP